MSTTEKFVQWRAFVGPPYKGASETGIWNWSDAIDYQVTKDPATEEPDTTVNSAINATATTVNCVATSGLPPTGGVWIGPGSSSEAWEYCVYTANDQTDPGNLTIVRDNDTDDGEGLTEFPGTHATGATVKFWWPLDAVGEPAISEEIIGGMSVVVARMRLEGVNAPPHALRIGHCVLFQIREVDPASGGLAAAAWKNEFLGWITAVRIRDDATKERTFDVDIRQVDAMAGIIEADSVQVGNSSVIKGTTTRASTTLAKVYKAHGEKEFVSSSPTLTAGNVVDGNRETLWISERYTGKANTPANPGTTAGVRSTVEGAISQFHVAPYAGQPPGYRWIEITMIDGTPAITDFKDALVYSKRRQGITGTATSTGSTTVLTDNTATWTDDEWIDTYIHNTTDGTYGKVTDNDGTTITHTALGSGQWDSGDSYEIYEHPWDYYIKFDSTDVDTSYNEGDSFILAESASLFSEENPQASSDAVAVYDITDFSFKKGIAAAWRVEKPSGSSTFIIEGNSGAFETGTLAATATAAQVADALEGIDPGADIQAVGWGGPLGTAAVYVALSVDDLDALYGPDTSLDIKSGSDSDANSTMAPIVAGNDVENAGSAESGNFFDVISSSEGSLTLKQGSTAIYENTQHTVRWGTMDLPPGAGDEETSGTNLWSGSNLSAITDGNTARLIYSPGGSPSSSSDYWEVSSIHTPGYEPVSSATDTSGWTGEWILIELPGMELELQSQVTANTASITVGNAGGATGNGLPDSGTLQIGSDQFTYTSVNRTTGVVSGIPTDSSDDAIGETHEAGDPVYIVVDSVATDAQLIECINLYRKNGQPTWETYKYYYSPYLTVRSPSDTTGNANYQDDYPDGGTQVNGATWTTDGDWEYASIPDTPPFGTSQRIKWLLLQVTRSEDYATVPDRVMLNEVEINLDKSVYASGSVLEDFEAAEVMEQLLDGENYSGAADLPDDAVTTTNLTGSADDHVSGFTTESGPIWPIIVDMAEFTNTRVTLDRCSKIDLKPDPWWGISGTPAETAEFTRSGLTYFEPNWQSGRQIGQIELQWRDVNNVTKGTEVYPATKDTYGRKVTVGPYVYADSTAAQAGAEKRYHQMRRPFDVAVEVLGYGRTYRPGDVYGIQWQLHDDMQAMNRTYMITAAEHRIVDHTWVTGLTLVQLTREDEK